MRLHPKRLVSRLLESLWFVPSAMTVTSILVAYLLVRLDRTLEGPPSFAGGLWILFDIGEAGARATLTAIATSVITVTGVVFSVTIVALQLAASQFTPRVLRTYLADRGNQTVLGIFIGTFTYTLLVQQSVGSPPNGGEPFIPYISVTAAIMMALISMGALIYFVNHIAQSMRASMIVDNVTRDARNLIEHLFPEEIGMRADSPEVEEDPPLPFGEPFQIHCEKAGYLDSVDGERILSVAEEGRLVIRMEPLVGDFVLPGEPLASVWLEDGDWNEERVRSVERKVRRSFVIRGQWTLHQDIERVFIELTDVAVRALSPSLNDPTTATLCVDRIGEILCLLGRRRFPSRYRTDRSGHVRVIARRVTWDRIVEVAFEKLRVHGARSPATLIRVVEVAGRVKHLVPPHRHPALDEQIRQALESGLRSFTMEMDVARIREAAEGALRTGRGVDQPVWEGMDVNASVPRGRGEGRPGERGSPSE